MDKTKYLFFDTETTGLGESAICWQIGLTLLTINNKSSTVETENRYYTLAYMRDDLPSRIYNASVASSFMNPVRDEAADHARIIMDGYYDPDEFKEYMREYLEEDRREKLSLFQVDWNEANKRFAWNLEFDLGVLRRAYDRHGEIFDPKGAECVMIAYKAKYPERRARLVDACGDLGIAVKAADLHQAQYDSELLYKVWEKMGLSPFRLSRDSSDRLLGRHGGQPVYLVSGRFGPYVQLGEQEEGLTDKPKRSPIPKGMKIDFEKAVALLALPRLIGAHPEDGEPIEADIDQEGPFVKHGRTVASLAERDDILSVGVNRAVQLLSEKE
jgi:hypothetical protein